MVSDIRMKEKNRKKTEHVAVAVIIIGLITVFSVMVSLLWSPSPHTTNKGSITKAYEFLESLYKSEVGLCIEYSGNNTLWLTHDNYLASMVLASWNRTIADNMTATIKRLTVKYNLPHDAHDLPIDTRIEILNGYQVESLNYTVLHTVNASYFGYVLRNENVTDMPIPSDTWRNYTDLTLYQTIIAWRKGDNQTAFNLFYNVTAMWDGIGFKDQAAKSSKSYSTFKLGFFLYVHRLLGSPKVEIYQDVINAIWRSQDVSGGFFTNYYKPGFYPNGVKANCETTAFILLGLPQKNT